MVLFDRCVERRILDRVVTEIKTFRLVDCRSNPLREIRVAQSSLLLAIFINQQFFQVIKVNLLLVAKITEHVLHVDVAIVIVVQS